LEQKLRRNIVFLQARLDSTRLPGKVLEQINGYAMIDLQILRIRKAKKIEGLVAVIPNTQENDLLYKHLVRNNVEIFRGPLENVLERFILASSKYPSQSIIRLTGDCPLVMPSVIDQIIEIFEESNLDYLSNTLVETYPDGLDVEIFRTSALEYLQKQELTDAEKEHVTLGIYRRPHLFKLKNLESKVNLGHLRWTVDYPEDLDFVRDVFEFFKGNEQDFEFEDLLEFFDKNPRIMNKKSNLFRNISLKNPDLLNGI
jgi:spore coat polysaccharide biosynthesis protein SpsF